MLFYIPGRYHFQEKVNLFRKLKLGQMAARTHNQAMLFQFGAPGRRFPFEPFGTERKTMGRNRFAVLVLVAVFLCSFPGIAGAEPPVTVIPNGVVNLTEQSGRIVRLTTSFPLKPMCLMEASDGTCIIQGSKFSLTAENKSMATFHRVGDKWVMTLHSGRVHYALRPASPIEFAHGHAVYELREISPAEANGNVTGIVAVVDDKLVFTNLAGEMVLAPTIAGVEAESVVVGPAAAEMSGTTAMALGGAEAAAVGAGAAVGLSSGKSSVSKQ